MKKIILTILACASFFSPFLSKAQDFFDTSDPEKFFVLGARVGFNTSNRTFPKGNFVNHTETSWGTGFNAGAVANLNIKEYFSLQPGFFYESRSSNLINIADYKALNIYGGRQETYYEKDHLRAYYFTIPIMGIVKFNLAENIKWNVELGPYIQFTLKQNGQNNVIILHKPNNNYAHYVARQNSFDFGFKMGSSLTFHNKYYLGFHYLAGVCHVWKSPSGGNNRSWQFSIGYDFY